MCRECRPLVPVIVKELMLKVRSTLEVNPVGRITESPLPGGPEGFQQPELDQLLPPHPIQV